MYGMYGMWHVWHLWTPCKACMACMARTAYMACMAFTAGMYSMCGMYGRLDIVHVWCYMYGMYAMYRTFRKHRRQRHLKMWNQSLPNCGTRQAKSPSPLSHEWPHLTHDENVGIVPLMGVVGVMRVLLLGRGQGSGFPAEQDRASEAERDQHPDPADKRDAQVQLPQHVPCQSRTRFTRSARCLGLS